MADTQARQVRRVPPERAAEVEAILETAAEWAAAEHDVRAVALVGSWARGEARFSSDVDLVVLVLTPERWLADERWHGVFGQVRLVATRDFGAVQERRLRRSTGLEVEVGIAEIRWAATIPIDPGTARVVLGGLRPIYDPDALLARLVDALGRARA